jgi:hypothetical protein
MNNIDNIIKLLDSNWIGTTVSRVVTYTKTDMYDSNNWAIKELRIYKPNNYYEIFLNNGLYMCLWDYNTFESKDCNIISLERINNDIEEMFNDICFADLENSSFIKNNIVSKFCK